MNTEGKPWLDKKAWADNQIRSNAKQGMYGLILFSLIWCGVIFFLYSIRTDLIREFEQQPFVALILLIPIGGISLLFSTYKAIKQWRNIGPSPVVLDPFPGSIGGHIGGFIETNIPYDPNLNIKIELQCIHSYTSGSGKNRSRKERIKWQKDGICHKDMSAKGSRFEFRFDVPENLPETDMSRGSEYHYWRMQISDTEKELKLDRQFTIPVFATHKQSVAIIRGTEEHKETKNLTKKNIQSFVDIEQFADRVELYFRAFQRPLVDIFTILMGLVFTGVGIGVGIYTDAPILFPIFFPLIGGLLLLGGLYSLGKALFVTINKEEITTRRYLFGLPITTRRISSNDFNGFKEKSMGSTQVGNKTSMRYQIHAINKTGKNLIVAERLRNQSELDGLKVILEKYISNAI